MNFREAVSALAKIGRDHSGMQYLRTYWYDAATDAGPTASHIEVASIPGVKLGLGQTVWADRREWTLGSSGT